MDEVIREVLSRYGQLAVDAADVGDDDDLYRAGLTSHACVSVMLALEDRLGVELPDEALTRATFASVGSIRAALASAGAHLY